MTERCFSFDLEWAAQDYPERGVKRGDLACLQWCELLQDGTTTEPELLAAWPGADQRARELFREALRPGWVIVGQNVAGDMLAAALQWGLLAEADEAYRRGAVRCTMLRQRLIDVAWPGRLTWVPLRRKDAAKGGEGPEVPDEVDDSQLDLVGGRQGFWAIRKYRPDKLTGKEVEFTEEDEGGGRGLRAKAGLDALAARYLGLDLSADKKGADSWRKRYGELIGIPVEDWPEDARRYALADPVLTARVCAAQSIRPGHPYAGQWCDVLYPPLGSAPWAPLKCERFEAHAHFALVDMEQLGLERDQPRIERMRATLQRAADAAEDAAIRAGVVRLEVRGGAKAAQAAGLVALEVKHDAAAGKAAGLAPGEVRALFRKARDAAAMGDRARVEALAAAHPWITVREKRDAQAAGLVLAEARAIADRRDAQALAEFAAAHPWLEVQRIKATDEVLSRAVALYKGAGWRELPRTDSKAVSAGAEHLQQVVRPAPGAPEDAAADLARLVSPDILAHLQEWSDAGQLDRLQRALEAANDPGLAAHLARQKCATFDSSFLASIDERHRAENPARWPDPSGPARFGFSPFKSTGRTGIRGDVRQNMPKSGGVRECFVPRRGRVFLCVDYAACEMSTFADVLDELVLGGRGWSTLGTAIRSGDDCHLRLAATMRGEPYAQLRAFYKPIKDKIEREGKGAIGKGELRDWLDLDLDRAGAKEGNFGYAGGMGAKKFARLQRKKGRDCDEARARRIRDAWLECWSPEVPAYFELASQATGDRGGRKSATVVHMRGGHVRGGLDFCQWANTHFQQLAAAGAKRAAILLFRACRLDTTSPLYGVADPALFVHDEFILECDEHAAEAALKEQERLMARGMAAVCRTPVKAEGKILRERWTK